MPPAHLRPTWCVGGLLSATHKSGATDRRTGHDEDPGTARHHRSPTGRGWRAPGIVRVQRRKGATVWVALDERLGQATRAFRRVAGVQPPRIPLVRRTLMVALILIPIAEILFLKLG
jgi:hypothetical protein